MLDISDDSNVHEIESFTENFSLNTSEMKLNLDESILAVAMAPDYEICTNIEIYTIDYVEKTLVKYHNLDNLSSSIEFMDFSSDSVFLMYMDNIKTHCFFDLKNKAKNDTFQQKYDVEWISDGLKISEKIRGLAPCYNEDNETTCLVRAGRKSLISCDQIGTVRIFEYPCEISGYYNIYSQHMSFISTIHVSKNGRFLITCSSIDKCIFVWEIKENRRDQ